MSQTVPIQFDPDVLAALEARAADIHASLSEVVNDYLRQQLRDQAEEDREDYALGAKRLQDPGRRWTMEEVEKELGLGD